MDTEHDGMEPEPLFSALLAERQVENIARVQGRALFMTMQVNAVRQQAERIVPDGAELCAMIAVAGAVEMTTSSPG